MDFSTAAMVLAAFITGACFGSVIVGLLNGSKPRERGL